MTFTRPMVAAARHPARSAELAGDYPRAMRPHPSGPEAAPWSADVVVVGGGIIGCAAAAIMADRGARVVLVERQAIGAGASGRNLGADPAPVRPRPRPAVRGSPGPLSRAGRSSGGAFVIGAAPAGLLLLIETRTPPPQAARPVPPRSRSWRRSCSPPRSSSASNRRLRTGRPRSAWRPATRSHPRRRRRRGPTSPSRAGRARQSASAARVAASGGRVEGVDPRRRDAHRADAVLVAAGPWTPRPRRPRRRMATDPPDLRRHRSSCDSDGSRRATSSRRTRSTRSTGQPRRPARPLAADADGEVPSPCSASPPPMGSARSARRSCLRRPTGGRSSRCSCGRAAGSCPRSRDAEVVGQAHLRPPAVGGRTSVHRRDRWRRRPLRLRRTRPMGHQHRPGVGGDGRPCRARRHRSRPHELAASRPV